MFPGTIAAQSKPTDSQTLEQILSELRQIRQDLRTFVGTAQKSQILASRIQTQQGVILRLHDRIETIRSTVTQVRSEEKILSAEMKRAEEALSRAENERIRKELEETISRLKAAVETQASVEQENQTKLVEAEDLLKLEQAKLDHWQDELDKLVRALEESSRK